MNLKTKYDFKDKVFLIELSKKRKWIVCEFCGGDGKVIGKDLTGRSCPDCFGNGGCYKFLDKKWRVERELTIGEIRVESRCEHITDNDSEFSNYGHQAESYKETYMCYETGIGSGTLWDVERLFKTKEDAQKVCDAKNKLLED